MDKKLILVAGLVLGIAGNAAANTCKSLSAGNLDTASRWSDCGGTYPQNGDSIIVNHAIIQNVPDLILGGSTAPVYGYVDSVAASPAGSGYTTGCAGGAVTGGTALTAARAAQTECGVVNGQAVLYLKYKGIYSSLTGLAVGAITATNGTLSNSATIKGNPTKLHLANITPWNVGSTQSIVLSGATGAWAGLNGSWTATVTSYEKLGTYFTIPFDSSALTGSPTGTITVAPGVTASYSLTTVAGGGTAAVSISNPNTASLTFAANTQLRGDVTYDGQYGVFTTVLVFNPGVTVTVDSRQAERTPMYRILGTNTTQNYRTIYAHCAGNPCRLEASGNVTSIESARYGPRLDIDTMTFYRAGNASQPAIVEDMNHDGGRALYSVMNSTFDTSGRVHLISAIDATATYHHDNNVHENSPIGPLSRRAFNITGGFANAVTTPGNWTIRRNSFDLGLGNTVTTAHFQARGVVVEDNYLGAFGGGTGFSTSKPASFARNYWQMIGNTVGPGDTSDTYFHLDVDRVDNPHWVGSLPNSGAIHTNAVFGFSGTNNSDGGEVVGGDNYAVTYGAVGSIFLCDAAGVGSSEMASATGTGKLSSWRLEHNTFCAGYLNFSPLHIDETGATTTGSITFRGNLLWSAAPSGSTKVLSVGPTRGTDVCAQGNCDYNGSYNLNVATNKGYGGAWSAVTPGVYDVDGQNPDFVDSTRRLENWDRKYLGPKGLIPAEQASPAAWTAGSYSQGDLVSHAHANLYGGETFNFRCRVASCTMEPGVPGTAWRGEWEWAAQYHLRNLMPGTQFTDADFGCSGCYPVQAVIQWVKAGFAPQNAAYQNAAHDGAWIGATTGQAVNIPAPVITPSTAPVVPVQTTYQFTADRPVTWSLAPGSAGSIEAETGVYTAPASISVKSKAGGCQAWANDHILTTRIDDPALVHPSAATWASTVHSGITGRLANIEDDFFTNITTSSHPAAAQTYRYTPARNGLMFQPSWPEDEFQGGALRDPHADGDRHVFWVARDTCEFQEIYAPGFYYPEGLSGAYPANNWTAGSGLKFNLADSYTLPQLGTNAIGIPFIPSLLRLADFDAGEIRHALGVTFANGYFHTQQWVWPGTSGSMAGPNDAAYPPYGTRFRLKSSYDISGFSPYAQMILTAFQRYGVYFSDGGTNFSITVDGDVRQHPDIWAALQEIRASGPQWAAHFEAVTNEPFKIDSTIGLVKTGTPYPVDDYVEVIATDTETGKTASRRVILRGIVVGVESQAITIQGGSSKAITTWVSGTENQAVTWSVPEGSGTVVNGVYTAPMLSEPTRRTLTVASAADPAATTNVYVLILPAGDMRIEAGGKSTAPADATYKYYTTGGGYGPDADGKMWWFDDGMHQGYNYKHDAWYTASGPPFPQDFGAWPMLPSGRAWGADGVYKLTVPPGRYRITAYFSKVAAPAANVVESGWLEVNGGLSELVDMSSVAKNQYRRVKMAAVVGNDGTLKIAARLRRLNDTSKKFVSPVLAGIEIVPEAADQLFGLIWGPVR